jgi:hypothetical protein
MTVTLNSEHDPAAEIFLTDIQQELSIDSVIPYLLSTTYQELESYLERQYFGGYFRKYELDIILCSVPIVCWLSRKTSGFPAFRFLRR